MNEGCMNSERKPVLFEEAIVRLEKLASVQQELTSRAYNKSVRIAATDRPSDQRKGENRQESVIGILHSIMDRIETNNDTLGLVVQDLENSIM